MGALDAGGGGGSDNEGTDDWGLTPGSNNWIDGTREFLNDPGQAVRDPYDFVAGVGDAAALNFDEGIGGLVSVVDGNEGNTAGPGQSPFLERPREDQPANPGLPDSEQEFTGPPAEGSQDPLGALSVFPGGLQGILALAVGVAALWLLRPVLSIVGGVAN